MKKSELKRKIIKYLRGNLPIVVSRKVLSENLGGLVCERTLANMDSTGERCISEKVKFGRNVGYPRDAVLKWVDEHLVICEEETDDEVLEQLNDATN
ncbi:MULTISPECIES: hypothetical protein [unclassified Maridesulfovibrio]|uniref:hypothetical protein n=1 Tax=unclassified Maridesulfovibrio TaxID=2794999 RepID=UPI003B3FF720